MIKECYFPDGLRVRFICLALAFFEFFEILFLCIHILHRFTFHSVLPLSLPIPERKHQRQRHHSTTGQPREKQAENSRLCFKQ